MIEADAATTKGIIGEGDALSTVGLIIRWEVVQQVSLRDVVILWP